MGYVGFEIALIGVLILINGFFAGAEAALISVRQTRVNELAEKKGIAGQTLKALKAAPERFLATVQVGITLVGTLASVVSGATVVRALTPMIASLQFGFAQRWPEQIAIVIVVAIISFASLVFGELVPKYLAIARPGRVALWSARPVALLSRLTHPLVVFLTVVSRFVTRLFGVRADEHAQHVTDQEIRSLTLEGNIHGSIDEIEHRMIHQTLDFSETKARQVMTPRPDIAAVDVNMPSEELIQFIRDEGYSRYPVYDKTIDKIVGVLYAKDIVHFVKDGEPIQVRKLMREPLHVPDSMSLSKVLTLFQTQKRHMAIVLDEFGGTAGLIALEDIIEEIVGDIQDEYDAEPSQYTQHEDGSALVAAGLPVIDFNERFDAEPPTDKGDTLGGLFVATLDRLPHKGDNITIGDVRLDIATLHGRRVKRLRARRVSPNDTSTE